MCEEYLEAASLEEKGIIRQYLLYYRKEHANRYYELAKLIVCTLDTVNTIISSTFLYRLIASVNCSTYVNYEVSHPLAVLEREQFKELYLPYQD